MENSALKSNNITAIMHDLGHKARAASRVLAEAKNADKDMALVIAARCLREYQADILEANAKDVAAAVAKKLDAALIDRLMLDPKRIESMAAGLETIVTVPDPVNRLLDEWERPNGLVMQRVSVPLGVIGIIYESRPNVTADAAALCIKSGNAAILRGGSESLNSSQAILKCIQEGLRAAHLPAECVQMVPTVDREAVGVMLGMVGLIDVIVPRGGKSLTQRVSDDSRIPTILHLDGNCHTYIHKDADEAMAISVLANAKMRRLGICGATESLLIDKEIAPKLLPKIADEFVKLGCVMRGDAAAQKISAHIHPATEDDWATEYLAAIISVKVVKDVTEAIAHINRYGSHHTDAIITGNKTAARQFLREVDSAIVMHNTSTQFADGGEFGFGGEIGISTGRLHARGPVGAEQLVTYKYVIHGTGQTRA
jgi:glutamate-5-semialdehyde dehydrogenase